MSKPTLDSEVEKFVEDGANLEHERWSRWQKYMFSKCKVGENGTLIIPKWAVDRWNKQINTSYSDLSEEEKESDRKEVRKYLPLLDKTTKQAKKEAYQEVLDDVIGEDELKKYNEADADGEYVERETRNQFRAEQREELNQLIKRGEYE